MIEIMQDRSDFLHALKAYGIENNIPNFSEENARYLRDLIQKIGAKNILEIGTANGYSSIHFADEMEKIWGKVTTIEFSERAYYMAQENFQAADVLHIITSYHWDAREIIPSLSEKYDFIFIDGLKKASLHFLKLCWEKAIPGGIIIIDDVIKFQEKMPDLYTYMPLSWIKYEILPIDGDDGIMQIEVPNPKPSWKNI